MSGRVLDVCRIDASWCICWCLILDDQYVIAAALQPLDLGWDL
jgi:hypothetical protein